MQPLSADKCLNSRVTHSISAPAQTFQLEKHYSSAFIIYLKNFQVVDVPLQTHLGESSIAMSCDTEVWVINPDWIKRPVDIQSFTINYL